MKKFFLVSVLMGVLPLSMMAQTDDLYFVPKKKSAKQTSVNPRTSQNVYYSGSDRHVDEYNRRGSSYEVIGGDTINDIIDFSAVQGVYPDTIQADSLMTEDFELTRRMQRFDDYNLSANAAFWAGYNAGLYDWGWGWHSPWYYNRYGWFGTWYDPWYYGSYWSDPWYWAYYGFGPYYYRYGWGYPYFYDYAYYPYYYSTGGGFRYRVGSNYGHTGSIRLNGSTPSRNTLRAGALSGSRTNSLRERTVGNHRAYGGSSASSSNARYSSGNTVRSNSGNFSGSRASSVSSSSSSGSFSSGGGGTRSSGGGSFSGGGGGSRSSGGGGGGSLGGRR